MSQLDKIDYTLLNLLQADASVTNASLSQKIGLSQTTIHERIKRLEREGIITNYYARIDEKKAGLGTTFFVQISLASTNAVSRHILMAKIQQLDEVVECHNIAGSCDLLLKIVTRDLQSFQILMMDQMSGEGEIGKVKSMLVLSVLKDSNKPPIPE